MIISQPAGTDAPTMEVLRLSHFDVRYESKIVGTWPFKRTEIEVQLRNSTNFGKNDVYESFTLTEWIEFTEEAPTMIGFEGGGMPVGVLYFTPVEWAFFLQGVHRGAFAPPPDSWGRP